MAKVLAYIHENHLIHRDIKPSNILIDQDGTLKMADLGLVKDTQVQMGLTMEGIAVGTPAYMSPEQLNAQKDIDIRTDIYSLGATLLHALTGRSRFGDVPPAVIYYRVTSEEELEFQKMAHISDGFNQILVKMLQPDREKRYQTPQALSEDLKLVIAGSAPQYAAVMERDKAVALESSSSLTFHGLSEMWLLILGMGIAILICGLIVLLWYWYFP
jgi:serine/threonine-protein kinase